MLKISKYFVVLLLAGSLTFCSMFKKKTPGEDIDGGGAGTDVDGSLPGGGGSDANVDLGGLGKGDIAYLKYKTSIQDASGINVITGGDEISYLSSEDIYKKGFTVDITEAGRLYREVITSIVPGNVGILIYATKTGERLNEVNQAGAYIDFTATLKKDFFCKGGKEVRVYATYHSKNSTTEPRDMYIEAPPIHFTGTYSCD